MIIGKYVNYQSDLLNLKTLLIANTVCKMQDVGEN